VCCAVFNHNWDLKQNSKFRPKPELQGLIDNVLEESQKVTGTRAYLYELVQGLVLNDKTKKKWDLNLFKVKFNRVEEIDFKDEIAHDIN
jgi:hypothetical protein